MGNYFNELTPVQRALESARIVELVSVVTEFIVKNSKKLIIWQFIISLLVNIFWM